MQIKIADFGLSRDFASTYMTGVLGTYVKNLLLSIGWPRKFSTISHTPSKPTSTLLELSSGK